MMSPYAEEPPYRVEGVPGGGGGVCSLLPKIELCIGHGKDVLLTISFMVATIPDPTICKCCIVHSCAKI